MATETKVFESVKDQADKILAEMTLPPEIVSISTDIGEDSAGDAALFVRLHLANGVGSSKKDVRALVDFTERVQILLMGSGVTYFPYVFLEEAA
jgi:hypothetical protein